MAKTKIFGAYRCIFPQLSAPKAFPGQEGGSAKFKITLLIPKSDKAGYKEIEDFLKAAIDECGEWKADIKKQVFATARKTLGDEGLNNNCILRDGDALNKQYLAEDKKPREAYAGMWVVTANRPGSWGVPMVVDRAGKEIPGALIDSTIRPGYHVNVELSTYCYKKPKNGIALQFSGVQLVKKDEEFGRQNNFAVVEGVDDEEISETFED